MQLTPFILIATIINNTHGFIVTTTPSKTINFSPSQRRPSSLIPRPSKQTTTLVKATIDPNHLVEFLNSFSIADADISTAADTITSSTDAITSTVDTITSGGTDVGTTAADAVTVSDPENPFAGGVSYSKLSYYTTLGLYALSLPGLWSQVKRSTSAKLKRKTYVSPGETVKNGKGLRQQAGEIMAYMKANNYEVVEAGEVIIFRGIVQRSKSQAFFLTFCTCLGMASLALVLQIQFNDITLPFIGKPNWFYLVLLSPYAGIYYWKSGDRVDDVKVKLSSNDEETENEITIEGDDEELDRMWRALGLNEKGMVRVEGLLS